MKHKLLLGNNLDLLKTIPDNSIDSVVTDPPYGLNFMNKKWDYDVPTVDFWKEIFRVLKPGGHVLSFGGTRTYHRMVVNIEDAGFEIRDQIQWIYGQGFPKSHNIGKAIDKLEGNEREVISEKSGPKNNSDNSDANSFTKGNVGFKPTFIETKGNSPWEGWGTALKPANEPICLARKPISEDSVAENVLKWGVGGINVDGCRVGSEKHIVRGTNISGMIGEDQFNRVGDERNYDGMNKEVEGRFPANIILECICDEVIKGERGEIKEFHRKDSGSIYGGGKGLGDVKGNYISGDKGDIHTNPDCPCRLMDEQSGSGASRFFMNVSYDNLEQKEYKKKKECQQNNYKLVQYVEQSGLNISQITELIAQTNVEDWLKDKLVLLVKSALNLSEKCTMYIVANIVAIATDNMGSPLTQGFIQELENYILIQSLARVVEIQDNIDTTKTTKSLMKLFGSVLLAIEKNMQLDQEQEKVEQKLEQSNSTYRFAYQSKVSKAERNMGLDDFEEQIINFTPGFSSRDENGNIIKSDGTIMNKIKRKNTHPTIKPINLMAYLCRLITPPNGIVLDPFMGSGSTGIAAKLEGFKFLGMEMDEDYYKIAEGRINSWEQYKRFVK